VQFQGLGGSRGKRGRKAAFITRRGKRGGTPATPQQLKPACTLARAAPCSLTHERAFVCYSSYAKAPPATAQVYQAELEALSGHVGTSSESPERERRQPPRFQRRRPRLACSARVTRCSSGSAYRAANSRRAGAAVSHCRAPQRTRSMGHSQRRAGQLKQPVPQSPRDAVAARSKPGGAAATPARCPSLVQERSDLLGTLKARRRALKAPYARPSAQLHRCQLCPHAAAPRRLVGPPAGRS
jgi:hypothetical protein